MTYDDKPVWDDVPAADPHIQKDYEAAFGEFLVRFNRIENIVNNIILLVLARAERRDIVIEIDRFNHLVLILELIALRFPEVASRQLISELRMLGRERNKLAHGHFEQNPYDGSYDVIARKKRNVMPVDKIRSLTESAEKAYHQLRHSEAYFIFEDLTWH